MVTLEELDERVSGSPSKPVGIKQRVEILEAQIVELTSRTNKDFDDIIEKIVATKFTISRA